MTTFGENDRPRQIWADHDPRRQRPVDFDPDDTRHDPNYGMPYATKRDRFPEIYRECFDPDSVGNNVYVVPREIQAAFDDVFGDYAKSGRIKLAMHPHFKRVLLWEKVLNPEFGEANWRVVQVFHEFGSVRPGYLPPDLYSPDGSHEAVRGQIGDFCQPNRQWFEWIVANCDRWRLSPEEMVRSFYRDAIKRQKEANALHNDYALDLHEYYFEWYRDIVNQEEGTGWKLSSYAQVAVQSNPRRWEVEEVRDEEGRLRYAKKRKKADPWTEQERALKRGDMAAFHAAHRETFDYLREAAPRALGSPVPRPTVDEWMAKYVIVDDPVYAAEGASEKVLAGVR